CRGTQVTAPLIDRSPSGSTSGVARRDGGITILAVPLVRALVVLANADAGRLAARRADQLHVRHVQRRLDLNDAGLAGAAPLDVLLDDVDALDHHPVLVDKVHADRALLP